MNSNDKAFLKKFSVKKSSYFVGLEKFKAAGFSIIVGFGWYSSRQWKNELISTHQIFTSSPWKPYSPVLLLEMKH